MPGRGDGAQTDAVHARGESDGANPLGIGVMQGLTGLGERRVGGDAFRRGGGHRLDGAPATEPIVQPIGICVAPVCTEDPNVGGRIAHQRHQEKGACKLHRGVDFELSSSDDSARVQGFVLEQPYAVRRHP